MSAQPLTRYEIAFILESMRIGERGQVTIPKEIRERFGLRPNTEVEFQIENGSIILRKAPKKLNLEKWKGHSSANFGDLGYSSVDDFMEDVRGR
jgi:AbrB family looped-hinge helix DNA binding protein